MPATKMPTPPKLKRGQRRLDHWRQSRGKEWRIPEELWAEAASLGAELGVSRTCAALRLNYTKLKRMVAELHEQAAEPEEMPEPEPEPKPEPEPELDPGPTTPATEAEGERVCKPAPEGTSDEEEAAAPASAEILTERPNGAPEAHPSELDEAGEAPPEAPTFLELFAGAAPSECQVELEDTYGRKMKVHLRGRIPDLAPLAQLLFGGAPP